MRGTLLLTIVAVLTMTAVAAAAPVAVTFQINDSYVKDKAIANVSIGVAASQDGPMVSTGTTDERGRAVLSLEPGAYLVTYRSTGYVPIEKSPIQVGSEAMTVTTTLTLMMEATGAAVQARIQIVLNWGSRPKDQVKDADAHILCACKAGGAHVYYGAQQHKGEAHSAELDVDDRDWGGPETVTLNDPVPGSYKYWVYDFSGSSDALLGNSDVVVRVILNDRLAGEYRMPSGTADRQWRPFKELVVEPSGEPRIVAFSAEDESAGLDRRIPVGSDWPSGSNTEEGTSSAGSGRAAVLVFGLTSLLAIIMIIKLRRRMRRGVRR